MLHNTCMSFPLPPSILSAKLCESNNQTRYVSEIFPSHLRSAGVAFSLASFYLASEVTLSVAPIAMDSIGWKFYLVLICPSFFFIIFLFMYLPETKGRTLEEIGTLFGDKNVANQWYGLAEEEKNVIYDQAVSDEKGDAVTAGHTENIEDIGVEESA